MDRRRSDGDVVVVEGGARRSCRNGIETLRGEGAGQGDDVFYVAEQRTVAATAGTQGPLAPAAN